nr:PEP-CTERM sorting domain-containing protein [uncultured Roseateles sp.]
MQMNSLARRALLAATALAAGAHAAAGVVTYSSQADFVSATSGLGAAQLSNFDAAGLLGNTYTGSAGSPSFSLSADSAGPATPYVKGGFWTTSGSQYLGLDNGDGAFLGGDSLTFNLTGSVRAFGLYVITGGDVVAGDIGLTMGNTQMSNGASADRSDGFGSYAYFFGLVSDTDLGSITMKFGDGSYLMTATVDDVSLYAAKQTGTIPEPASLALLSLGLLALCATPQRQRAKPIQESTV